MLRALGLGDLLTAVPALRALRAARPDHRVVLATPRVLQPLVALTDAVDEVLDVTGVDRVPAPTGPPRRPALAVNLHGRGPQSHRWLLAHSPGELVAFAAPSDGSGATPRGGPAWVEDHEVRRWCALLEAYGIRADPTDLGLRRPEVAPAHRGAVVLHPGAASVARRWPAGRWAAVARALGEAGHRVVVTAGPGERALAQQVAERSGAVTLSGLGLLELTALVADARLLVCGDTGVAHLATATATPSVVLFGPTSPGRWGPLGERRQHVCLWHGRVGDPHAGTPDAGLLAIGVEEVLGAARTALATPATVRPRADAG